MSPKFIFLLQVKFFPGRKLDYELKDCEKHTTEDKTEQDFMTLVEFSAKDPYGKAVALLHLKSGCIKVLCVVFTYVVAVPLNTLVYFTSSE